MMRVFFAIVLLMGVAPAVHAVRFGPGNVRQFTPASVPNVPIPRLSVCSATTLFSPVASAPLPLFLTPNLYEVPYSTGFACPSPGTSLRARLLTIRSIPRKDRPPRTRTEVAAAGLVPTNVLDTTFGLQVTVECAPFMVFYEFCGGFRGTVRCEQSNAVEVPAQGPRTPILRFRPPYTLRLAPGDNAVVVNEISRNNVDVTGPFALSGLASTGPFVIGNVAERLGGEIVENQTLTVGRRATTRVPIRDDGVSVGDDGMLVYLRYALADCERNGGSFREEFATSIRVSAENPSLVRQDVRLPTIMSNGITAERNADNNVVVSIDALNNGGGMLGNGEPPILEYQWFRVDEASRFLPFDVYIPITGATGPSFEGIGTFVVDVCNTFGCFRTQKVTVTPCDVQPRPSFC